MERAAHIVLHDLIAGVGAETAVDALAGLPAWDSITPHRPLPTPLQRAYDQFRTTLGVAKPDVIGDPAIADSLAAHLRAMAGGREAPAQALAAVDRVAREQQLLAR